VELAGLAASAFCTTWREGKNFILSEEQTQDIKRRFFPLVFFPSTSHLSHNVLKDSFNPDPHKVAFEFKIITMLKNTYK